MPVEYHPSWDVQRPYYEQHLAREEDLIDHARPYFPGTTVAPLDPAIREGINRRLNIADTSSTQLGQREADLALDRFQGGYVGQDVLRDAAGGGRAVDPAQIGLSQDILNNENPYIDNVIAGIRRSGAETAAEGAGRIRSQFGARGTPGSAREGLATAALNRGVASDVNTQIGQALEGDYNRRFNAALQAGTADAAAANRANEFNVGNEIASAGNLINSASGVNTGDVRAGLYDPSSQYVGSGALTQSQTQSEIDADRSRFEYNRELPFQQSANFGRNFQIAGGGVSQSTATPAAPAPEPQRPSTLQTLAGLAAIWAAL